MKSSTKAYEKVDALRQAQIDGLTAEQLAEKMDVTPNVIRDWARRYQIPLQSAVRHLSEELREKIANETGTYTEVAKKYDVSVPTVANCRRAFGKAAASLQISREKILKVIELGESSEFKTNTAIAKEVRVCVSTVSVIRRTAKAIAWMQQQGKSLPN